MLHSHMLCSVQPAVRRCNFDQARKHVAMQIPARDASSWHNQQRLGAQLQNQISNWGLGQGWSPCLLVQLAGSYCYTLERFLSAALS